MYSNSSAIFRGDIAGVVEQAAHSAYFEQPEVFNARVLEFLVRLG